MPDYPDFDLLDTPNPNESVAIVTCEVKNLRGAQMPVRNVTTYAQFEAGDRSRVDEYGSYIFVKKTKPGAGLLTFHFVKVRTPLERNTPFDSYEETEDVDWLAVCSWIDAVPNYGAPRSQNTTDAAGKSATVIIPRWAVRRGYVHGQRLKTRVKVRLFLSEVPYPQSLTESDEPMGTEISWDLEGNNGTTGRCLHPEKTMPGQGSSYAVISNAGKPECASGPDNRSQYFPKTNHTRWQDFITNEVKFIEPRLFLRIERTYIAPQMPKESVLV